MRVSGGTCACLVLFIGMLLTTMSAAGQEALPFRRAIELALAHSSEMAVSQADRAWPLASRPATSQCGCGA